MYELKCKTMRDSSGHIEGYRLGNHYLIKHYYDNNHYSWLINSDGRTYYYPTEITRGIDNNEIEIAFSCKEGKLRLIQLYNEEHVCPLKLKNKE